MIIVNFAIAVAPRTSAKLTGVHARHPPGSHTARRPPRTSTLSPALRLIPRPAVGAFPGVASHQRRFSLAPHGWRISWRGLSSAPFLARASQPTSRRRNPFPGLSPSPFLAPRSEERRGDGRLPSATIGPAIQALAPAQGHDHRVASGLTSRERRQQE